MDRQVPPSESGGANGVPRLWSGTTDDIDRADALLESGDARQAEVIYRSALAGVVPAVHGMGQLAARCGAEEASLAFFRVACELGPTLGAAWLSYGQALLAGKRPREAGDALDKAMGAGADTVEALVLRGLAFHGEGRLTDAGEYLERAVRTAPQLAMAWNGLGIVRAQEGRLSESAEVFRRSLSIDPENSEVWNCLGVVLYDQGLALEGHDALSRAVNIEPDSLDIGANRLFYCNCSTTMSAEQIATAHREWGDSLTRRFKERRQGHTNSRETDRRLRVAYLSGDFREHPVASFLAPVLEAHCKDAVDVICYSTGSGREDFITARLRSLVPLWRNVADLNDDQAEQLIRGDRVDILVDLGGYTADGRPALLARKPAPVQVTYLGYPNTTGMPTVDYRITDALADPPERAPALHVEELSRPFTSFLCYEPPHPSPPVATAPVSCEGTITFGSFNHTRKLNPVTVDLWSAVLRSVPSSRLVLKAQPLSDELCRRRICAWFEGAGVSQDRIAFLPYQTSSRDHLRCYEQVDIALDTFPYNGTTTTCEALWMGVPTITLSGDDHRSRVGLSILANVGLAEFAASTREAFVGLAVTLASDSSRLEYLRAGMRERLMRSPLLDAVGFTRALEGEYRAMWKRWCASTT